jgi:hypothetical protein
MRGLYVREKEGKRGFTTESRRAQREEKKEDERV